jgi:hypothetical protein
MSSAKTPAIAVTAEPWRRKEATWLPGWWLWPRTVGELGCSVALRLARPSGQTRVSVNATQRPSEDTVPEI